ncbi:hypothetical protein IW140_002566 [Coemansia sp. RSA 1813]|nr:hypothetical protein LPJ74_001259 [Coemansia sp. RSA 1843]KAJ2090685.1 hypothetical protein IW138_002499 [Coemansia sp. RSA 986]KAJ2216112.1 hypothetical protein EV179_001572 [Coemansia sp. RSA 487]KAJ2570096.1 hypothetical protein IW140_002566 [Coemansia sp. RSA 1813]
MTASGSSTTTNRKALALKHKLQKQNHRHLNSPKTHTKSLESRAKRQQREKALEKAFSSKSTKVNGISHSSTKHSAGRREVCLSLDRTIARSTQISEALRGIGGRAPDILTPTQLAAKAREEREKMAVAYEQHQASVTEAVDELAQLMSE